VLSSEESVSAASTAPSVCLGSCSTTFFSGDSSVVASARLGATSGELAPGEPCLDPNCSDELVASFGGQAGGSPRAKDVHSRTSG
jgi:hypothetical protein